MVLNNEAKILIKNLYPFKNYSARKLIKKFPEKGWKLKTLNLSRRSCVNLAAPVKILDRDDAIDE